MRKTLLLGAWAVAVCCLLNPALRAADPDAVKKAVEAGVANLKQSQSPDGTWGNDAGATALAAMTLLECGVAADDPAIKKAAEYVRNASVDQRGTYQISLAILFLDKLREPVDVALIESLTVRLMAGQNAMGGWSYHCPLPGDEELKRLQGLLKNRNELVGERQAPKSGDVRRTPNDLPNEIKAQLQAINRGMVANPVNDHGGPGGGDNSNTQFATLALWVGRRQGLPVENALGRVNVRYRKSVNADGGWGYHPGGGPHPAGLHDSSASMTCAGLLGLAVAYGVATELAEEKVKQGAKDKEANKDKEAKPPEGVPDISKDGILLRGVAALGTTVGYSSSQLKAMNKQVPPAPQIGGKSYYFLWSLERVCVALDLDTIGGKEWYDWGCEVLIANQQFDGSWQGDYANYKADTCFALLFLKRSNFVRDLSARLKGKLDHKTLRGGVGGEGLKERLGGGLAKPGESGDSKETKPAGETKEIEKLAREVADAKGKHQDELLTKLRDSKGQKYTDALVAAISQLTGEAKKNARKALAERLKEETAEKLTDLLDDRDVEVRRAAVLACALKESKQHIPQLIGMVRDREPLVARAAWAALKNMTGENFGPSADATDEQKDKAIEAWRAWWAEQKAKNGK
jgi:hypothetical protein